MSSFERSRKPEMPKGLNVKDSIAWLNEHHPVGPSDAERTLEVDPHWYEKLAPVEHTRQLKPHLFGLRDTEEKRYGWVQYNFLSPDNLLIQQRAAEGLVRFTGEKDSMDGLWYVYYSLESDGGKGYHFRLPPGGWDMPKRLREYQEANDIKGAAYYTAELLFSPWQ